MDCPSHVDLTKSDGIKEYLQLFSNKMPGFLSSVTEVTVLSGGTTNFIYRLHLHPTPGQVSTAILKHSTGYVASIPSMEFDVDRWDLEEHCLRSIPSKTPVFVPEVFFSDNTNHIIVMSDIETAFLKLEDRDHSSHSTLKELLMAKEPLSAHIAAKIGASLGAFLKSLHTCGLDPSVKSTFENRTARKMCKYRTWQRLPPIITTVLGATAVEEVQLSELFSKMSASIETDSTTITMGDFWPGNILVRLNNDKKDLDAIFVVDWELAHPGRPATDVGQLTSEVWLAARFASQNSKAAEDLLNAFNREYVKGGIPGNEDGGDFTREVMVYAGGHIAGWIRAAGWTRDNEEIRTYVSKGVRMMQVGAGIDTSGIDVSGNMDDVFTA